VARRLSAVELAQRDAAITLALVAGESWDAIAKRLGISKETVSDVSERLKAVGYDARGAQEKRARFVEAFEGMATAYMDMLTAHAELLSDPAYISKQTTSDVIAHSAFVGDRFERVVRLQRSMSAPAGPDALPEHVTAEIVDAEPLPDVA
jgi:DNA-binding transcriptional regulator LsrR (DeoR family)